MNIQYFKSAWGDIKNSPGWFGKLCLLALLNFMEQNVVAEQSPAVAELL